LKDIENELGTDDKQTPNETRFSSLNTTKMLNITTRSALLRNSSGHQMHSTLQKNNVLMMPFQQLKPKEIITLKDFKD